MSQAQFRFYEELNDFLPPGRQKCSFMYHFDRRASVKDMVEALGVPHTEVDLILINGESVGFSQIVADGDRVSVYPVFESFDIAPLTRLRPRPLRRIRLLVDVNLGRLARYLRLLGLDTLYGEGYEDAALARISVRDKRILLTRDRGLLKRAAVTHGYYVRATDPREQTREVVRRLDLQRAIRPFTRCTRCNGAVESVPKETIAARLPEKARAHHESFWQCRDCRQLYWKGSHYEKLCVFVEQIVANSARSRRCQFVKL